MLFLSLFSSPAASGLKISLKFEAGLFCKKLLEPWKPLAIECYCKISIVTQATWLAEGGWEAGGGRWWPDSMGDAHINVELRMRLRTPNCFRQDWQRALEQFRWELVGEEQLEKEEELLYF